MASTGTSSKYASWSAVPDFEGTELNTLRDKKELAKEIEDLLLECGLEGIQVRFKGAKRGKQVAKKKSPARQIDEATEEFFNSLKVPVGWVKNGMGSYIQYSKVKMLNGKNFKQVPDYADAMIAAYDINKSWADLIKSGKSDHPMFFSKYWSLSKPPVMGVIRNKTGYDLRGKAKPVAQRKPCQQKKDADGNYLEGLYSWGLEDIDGFLDAFKNDGSEAEAEAETESSSSQSPSEEEEEEDDEYVPIDEIRFEDGSGVFDPLPDDYKSDGRVLNAVKPEKKTSHKIKRTFKKKMTDEQVKDYTTEITEFQSENPGQPDAVEEFARKLMKAGSHSEEEMTKLIKMVVDAGHPV
jgi:hypothetical protein